MNKRMKASLARWRSVEISSGKKRLRLGIQLLFITAAALSFFLAASPAPEDFISRFRHFAVLGLVGAAAQTTIAVHVFRSTNIPLYVRDALDIWIAISAFYVVFTQVMLTVISLD